MDSVSSERKYDRTRLAGLAMVRIVDTGVQFSGPIEDISRGGIGIYTREKVKKGARVSIKIFFKVGTISNEAALTGTIITEEKKTEFGSIGIKFDKEVNFTDQPHLYNFLMSQEKTKKGA